MGNYVSVYIFHEISSTMMDKYTMFYGIWGHFVPHLTSFSGLVAGLVVQWSPQQSAAGGVVRSNPAMGKLFSPRGTESPL